MLMQEEEEIFDIAVNIHEGLEPLIFTIIVSDDTSTPEHVLDFKVTRNKETLGIIRPDGENSWQLLAGDLEQEQVDALGEGIDKHYC